MKLLYITQYFPPEVGAGAVRSEAMVRYLSNDGWDVDVLTEIPNYPTGIVHSGYRNQWSYKEKVAKATVYRVWVWANQRNTVLQQVVFFVSFMISSLLFAVRNPAEYDVVYVSSPPIFAGISGCLISKIFNAKFVFEVRDLWPDSAVNGSTLHSNSLFIRMGRIIEKWLYHAADLIIPVTEQSSKIIKAKSNGTPMSVFSNGVDLNLFRKIDFDNLKIDEFIDSNKFRVGYVGSLGVIHDLETFVRAAKSCEDDPEIEFIIVGDGGRNNKLQAILDKYKPQNLNWVGLKEHSKIPHYISSFDVAINPVNDSEAFRSIVTVKFYEYLACETPVISSANGALEEIGQESQSAITIPPGDADELSKTIRELKNSPRELYQLSLNARSFVKENFSRQDVARKLSDKLKRVIN